MVKEELFSHLVSYEPEAVVRTLAMMAYNPSIGRVLQEEECVTLSNVLRQTPSGCQYK